MSCTLSDWLALITLQLRGKIGIRRLKADLSCLDISQILLGMCQPICPVHDLTHSLEGKQPSNS